MVERRAHLSVGRNSKRIGAIGWLMYHIYIGTIIIRVGSNTVLAIGSGSQAYQRSVLSVQVYIYIGTRLIRSQSILVITVIRFIGVSARILICSLTILFL